MNKEKDYIGKSIKEVLDAWNNYVKEKTPTDYEWHDVSNTYKLFGFEKVRYNKEHPHTIDLMKADDTIYYAVYPTNVTTMYDAKNNRNIKCTFTFGTKQEIKDFDLTLEVE